MTKTKQTQKPVEPEAQEPTVTVYLPDDGCGAYVEGAWNGVSFRIPTDTAVEVPARIAAILRESRRTLLEGGKAVEAFRSVGGRKLG